MAEGNRWRRRSSTVNWRSGRTRYPDLDVESVVVHGNTLDYLTEYANSIQLLVVGHERARGIKDLVGPPGYASLHEARLFGLDLPTADRIVSILTRPSCRRSAREGASTWSKSFLSMTTKSSGAG